MCCRTNHGNDSFLALLLLAHHCVGFARSCLAVSEDANIVALKSVLQHFFANIVEHKIL